MMKSIRILISIAAHCNYDICQMDVKTGFLNRSLDELIYMAKIEGFMENEPCIFKKWDGDRIKFLVLYVDVFYS